MAEIYTLKYTGAEIDEAIGVIKNSDIVEIDVTLSTAGKAADAAVVGKEVADLAKRIASTSAPVQICDATEDVIVMNDSMNYPLQGLMLYGKTTQMQIPGRNLLDINTVEATSNGAIELIGETLRITTPTAAAWAGTKFPVITLLAGVSYTLSANVDTVVSGVATFGFRKVSDNKFVQPRAAISATDFKKTTRLSVTYVPTEDIDVYVSFLCTDDTATDGDVTYSQIQLEIGSNASDYIPYVGEKISPNVDYPQDLVSVGDIAVSVHGKNLLDLSKAERTHTVSKITVDTDKLHVVVTEAKAYSGAKLPVMRLQAGVTYTMSAIVDCVSGSPRIGLRRASDHTFICRASGKDGRLSTSYTPEYNIDVYANLMVTEAAAMTGEATFSDVQFEIGNVATDYEPYKDGSSLTVSNTNVMRGILVENGGNYVTDKGAHYIADYIDFVNGKRVQMIGVIESYAGEEVGDIWQSSTGALSTGANVIYVLDKPIVTELEEELTAGYTALCTQYPITSIVTNSDAGMAVSYATTGNTSNNDWYIAPVSSAWEQRMLDRIDQCLIPMTALRDIPKAPNGYTRKGKVLTGINYSSVHGEDCGKNMVGVQIPLSTYYSALENPASKMYTADVYQDHTGRSSYYGIVCSGFASYVIGASSFMSTSDMANMVINGKWTIVPVAVENDLFKVKRGDILLNTIADGPVISRGDSNHVRIVRDVVHDAKTGRLVGFNLSESWKPFCKTTFYNLTEFLAQMYETQPYRVVRLDDVRLEDGTYSLDVEDIKYSNSVYPDKGDGGRYAVGEEIWLYLPNCSKAKSITYILNDSETVVNLTDLESSYVNGVIVYKFPISEAGVYTISIDIALDDPCTITVS